MRTGIIKVGIGALALSLVGMLALSGAAGAYEKPFQGVLHGFGCGDPLKISAISRAGEVTGDRVLVRGKPGYQLSAKAISNDQKQFFFTAWNCEDETFDLYRQYLGRKPSADLIMSLPPGWWMTGVTWDMAREAPAVLLRSPDFVYQLQVLQGGGWQPLWTGTTTDFGGKYPQDLEGRSGFEYLIVADDLRSSWGMYRVTTSGRYSGYMGQSLTGPGSISEIADGFGDSTNVYVSRDGTWICDWSASGTIQEAITQGKCVTVPGGAAYRGVSVIAEDGNDWLILNSSMGASSRTLYECVGGNFISCGSPVVGEREVMVLNGSDFVHVYLGEGIQRVKTPFKRLGASRI